MESSFARGLRVLNMLLDQGELRVEDLSEQLQIPTSTTYRFLRDLRTSHMVEESNGSYRIAPRLRGDANAELTRTDLRQLAGPTLRTVCEESGETTLIAIRVGDHALCLDQVESPHAMRMAFRIGERLPLHAGATARVLLAFSPPHIREEIIRGAEQVTDDTLLGDDLRSRLEQIRRTGVSTSRAEMIPHAIAIAVPVFQGDRCICSLGVAGPDRRSGAKWQRDVKGLLQRARTDLEALL